jgi:hypothetical protein
MMTRVFGPNRLRAAADLMLLNHTAPCGANMKANCTMPTAESFFSKPASKYFRASEFNKEMVLTIKDVERVEFTNDGVTSPKPVLSFNETSQGLVLNRTNFAALTLMLGEDSDDWRGAKIALAAATTDFKGRTMPTIKVKRPQKAAAAQASGGHPFNDDIQF